MILPDRANRGLGILDIVNIDGTADIEPRI